jgi:hypothetical protein
MNGEEMNACRIHTCDHEISADVALVSEKVLFQHRHTSDYARQPASGKRVQFNVGADESGGKLGIGGRSGAGTPNLGCYIVQFLTILFISGEYDQQRAHHPTMRWEN